MGTVIDSMNNVVGVAFFSQSHSATKFDTFQHIGHNFTLLTQIYLLVCIIETLNGLIWIHNRANRPHNR